MNINNISRDGWQLDCIRKAAPCVVLTHLRDLLRDLLTGLAKQFRILTLSAIKFNAGKTIIGWKKKRKEINRISCTLMGEGRLTNYGRNRREWRDFDAND